MIPTRQLPPKDQMRFVMPVIRPKPKVDLKVVHLSKHWVGIGTHYDGKRTVPCLGELFCTHCQNRPAIWKGFAVVREWSGTRRGLIQITPNVVADLSRAVGKSEILTGLVAVYRRSGCRVNSPLVVQTYGRNENEETVSFEDTYRMVCRLFRVRPSEDICYIPPTQV